MCDGKNHNLEVIFEHCYLWDTLAVVRWRSDCGAVVVDQEHDNRLSPGHYMKMKFPKQYKNG